MGDIQTAEAAVVSKYDKTVAWVKAHVPHGVISVVSYVGGKLGAVGALFSMIGKFY